MEGKSSTQSGEFFDAVLPFDNVRLSVSTKMTQMTILNLIFLPYYKKFVVECSWNNKISQNVRVLGFLLRKHDKFFEKKLDFFKKVKVGKIAVECVSIELIL